jgi:predicted glycoside hydrolase/deacetylase ChbG (UPF0249 family)
MVRIIINSDDFGLSKEVNDAIALSFQENLISSTTCLVNFDDGLQYASMLVKQGKVPADAIGIHFNLSEGFPISDEILSCNEFCENGKFHGKLTLKPIFLLDKHKSKILYNELELQLKKFIRTFGFSPSHIDGHHHIQTQWAVIGEVMKVAKKYKIKRIRISRNVGQGISVLKLIYKKLFNKRLKINGFITTDFFGDIDDFIFSGIRKNGIYEIMVHSLPSKEKNCVNDINGKDLNIQLSSLKGKRSFNLFNYNHL